MIIKKNLKYLEPILKEIIKALIPIIKEIVKDSAKYYIEKELSKKLNK